MEKSQGSGPTQGGRLTHPQWPHSLSTLPQALVIHQTHPQAISILRLEVCLLWMAHNQGTWIEGPASPSSKGFKWPHQTRLALKEKKKHPTFGDVPTCHRGSVDPSRWSGDYPTCSTTLHLPACKQAQHQKILTMQVKAVWSKGVGWRAHGSMGPQEVIFIIIFRAYPLSLGL